MTEYQLREQAPKEFHKELSEYPELLRELLWKRDVRTPQEAKLFLHPEFLRDTHDPLLMKGMQQAVARIAEAIGQNQQIVIFADYDHDGIPGAVVLGEFFKVIDYHHVAVYIPHRNEEGFGLQMISVERLTERRAELVITVDCGISAVEPVEELARRGIDVIITDHHAANGTLPPAVTIVNPKQAGDIYPFQELCGSGVVFKLVQALVKKLKTNNQKLKTVSEEWEESLLDLVGIATIGDMVSLTGENRVLAHAGLTALRKTKRPGLKALMGVTRLNQPHISEDDVAFMITPRINAASRMDTPEFAYQLLAAATQREAEVYATKLNQMNDQRKGVVAGIVKEVHKRLSSRNEIPNVIVMGDKEWQPGLLGLAANAVMEKEGKTAFLWGKGMSPDIRGSCRSQGSVDVVALMQELPEDTFIEFGGHTNSGGFSIKTEQLLHLEEHLNTAYQTLYGTETIEKSPQIVDAILALCDITWKTYADIELLGPFGVGNTKPIFLFQGVTITEIKHFGSNKNHLQLTLHDEDTEGIHAMSFFNTRDSFKGGLEEGMTITLAATIEKSVFRGSPELRLRIVDIF